MTVTLGSALDSAASRLRAAGVASPELDAQLLAARALGWTRARVQAERRASIDRDADQRLGALLERRARREPLAYIVGEKEFWSLSLGVDARVLVPRPETETLVERALVELRGFPLDRRRVVDVGTGSGAIALAIASERDAAAEILAIDRSIGALAVARENLRRHAGRCRARVEIVRGDLLGPLAPASADLVVANPPYLSDAELRAAEPELGFEPRDALVGGGADGLAIVGRLLADAARVLREGGAAVVEIGATQGAAALRAAQAAGLADAVVERDLGNRDRVLVARRRECRVGRDSASGAA